MKPHRLVVPLPRFAIFLALTLGTASVFLSVLYFRWPVTLMIGAALGISVRQLFHRPSARGMLWLWPGWSLSFAEGKDLRHRTRMHRFGPWVLLQARPRRGGRVATCLVELPALPESDRWALAYWCATGRPPRSQDGITDDR